MNKIWITTLVWINKKFIQNPMLIIPASMLTWGISWGLVTSIVVNGETVADSWSLLFMGHIGFFLPFNTNSIFYYGFVTGLFYGIFAGLVSYISFTRNIDNGE